MATLNFNVVISPDTPAVTTSPGDKAPTPFGVPNIELIYDHIPVNIKSFGSRRIILLI